VAIRERFIVIISRRLCAAPYAVWTIFLSDKVPTLDPRARIGNDVGA